MVSEASSNVGVSIILHSLSRESRPARETGSLWLLHLEVALDRFVCHTDNPFPVRVLAASQRVATRSLRCIPLDVSVCSDHRPQVQPTTEMRCRR